MDRSRDKGGNWLVGVLFSQTGATAAIEQTQLNATLLAIDEINSAGGVLGRMVEPVIYDSAADPKQARALAERLFLFDDIRLLFGCYMSSTRKAVLPVVESHHGLLFYPTLYEGFEYSRHCIYSGAAPNQNSLQLAHFLLSNFGNRFFLVGSNYIYPYEFEPADDGFRHAGARQGARRNLCAAAAEAAGFREGRQADQDRPRRT